jgi:hypothetical protein
VEFACNSGHLREVTTAPGQAAGPDLVERGVLLLRLRQMMILTLVVWPTFGVLDWYVATFMDGGRLWVYVVLRLGGLVPAALTLLRCHLRPAPSVRALTFYNDVVFTSIFQAKEREREGAPLVVVRPQDFFEQIGGRLQDPAHQR